MLHKFANFPTGYYITLEESVDRQQFMEEQFSRLGISSIKPLRSKRFAETQESVVGNFVHQLDDGTKGCAISHLKALQLCLQTDSPWFFICEDDISFELSSYWPFTWIEFVNSLPSDWDVVQLHCIRSNLDSLSIRERQWDDWSVGAYLIKREYAQRLVDWYVRSDCFYLECPTGGLMPLVENIVYTWFGSVYCCPLFVENVNFLSTFKQAYEQDISKKDELKEGHKVNHLIARDLVVKLWKGTQMSPLDRFVKEPENPEVNFNLGLWYEERGHTAAAISYFIRAADRSLDEVLAYESMIRAARCFERQGGRHNTVKGMYESALTICPKRPEAYFLLSEYQEKCGERYHAYNLSTMALGLADFNASPLRTDVGYRGKQGILFEQAVTAWSRGLCDDSRRLFHELADNYDLDYEYSETVQRNLVTMGISYREPYAVYDRSKHSKLKLPFKDSELIETNYSQAYQDMFILTMLDGKRNGKYLEVGAGPPFKMNNTALLEKRYGWTGVSLEIQPNLVEEYKRHRSNPIFLQDALKLNYTKFLKELNMGTDFDYLQLDCEPPRNTFEILLSIPFEHYRFAVITFEHDHYQDISKTYRDKSRRYLQLQGYRLVANDIAVNDYASFEDWWVHPDLVDQHRLAILTNISDKVQKAERYLLSI